MNAPEGQQRIHTMLQSYVKCYLDTAPKGGELARAKEVFLILRRYFQRVTRAALDDMESPIGYKADLVLGYLDSMEVFLRTDPDTESEHERNIAQKGGIGVTPEDIDAFSPEERERWEEFKDKLINDLGRGPHVGDGGLAFCNLRKMRSH